MEAQIKEGGRVYKGYLAELFVKKGIAKKIETRGRKPNTKEKQEEKLINQLKNLLPQKKKTNSK